VGKGGVIALMTKFWLKGVNKGIETLIGRLSA